MENHTVRASQLPTARRDTNAPTSSTAAIVDESLVLGRYKIGNRLGVGAFGTVYRARDQHLERDVALKVVPRERVIDPRFAREAHAAARLSHPGIVTLYEAAEDDEDAYLVSELVRGATLDRVLEAGRLSDRGIAEIGIVLCDALAHAHAHGIVHRDVKPSNVLIPARPTSAACAAKLTDFGIARVIGGDSLTRTNEIVGTDAYMAPEQAVGREAGAPADLYALALVLYEALTGINPIAGVRQSARLGAHLPPLRRQRRDLPRELGAGIDLALRPRPRERGTIEELKSSLTAAVDCLRDVPGVVEGPWRPRLTRTGQLDEGRVRERRRPAEIERESGPARPSERPAGGRAPVLERGLACAATVVLTAWLAVQLTSLGTITPAVVGLAAAAAVLLLPRLGFVLTAAALATAAALDDHVGGSLVIVVGALTPIVLAPRDKTTWPLAAGAPALGLLGLGGVWPALAARANTVWRRAALGATGWIWLVLATPLSGGRVYLATPAGMPARTVWTASLYETVHHVLAPLLSAGVLAAAVVWALAAVVLPRLVRGSSLMADAVRVVAWAAIVVSATEIALRAGGFDHPTPRGAVLGAVVAAAVALAPSAFAAWRPTSSPGEPRPGVP